MSTNRKTQPRRVPDGMVITSISISEEQHKALKAWADREHRTLSQQMRVVIDQALETLGPQPAEPTRKAA